MTHYPLMSASHYLFCFIFLVLLLSHISGIVVTKQPLNQTKNTKKISTKQYKWELDTQQMLKSQPFTISPDKLIARCKDVVDKGIGLKRNEDLADDFVFQFPIVGPLSKTEYLNAVGGFSLGTMFPGFDEGLYYDFRVDPYQTNRVWFTAVFRATHANDGPFGKATLKDVECPPQAISLIFDKEGKVVKYTGGYVMDKERGNSGGLGGIFGPLYAIGRPLPFPEARPFSPSLQYRAFNLIGTLATKFSNTFKKK